MNTSKYPTLYKMTSTGKIQQWKISTGKENQPYYEIEYGQQEGKKTSARTKITAGKNIGKKNETTPEQQVELEATSLWSKQKDRKGYSEDIPTEAPKLPMLAKNYETDSKHIIWPCFVQPKLDGCVVGNTKIKTDIGEKRIDDIVKNKISCKVLSFNLKTGKEEYKNIINWFDNGKSNRLNWLDVITNSGNRIRCTKNHKIYTNNGWKKAEDLSEETDKILSNDGSARSNSLLLGTFLGDTCLALNKTGSATSWNMVYQHTNSEYFKFKTSIFNFSGKVKPTITGYGSEAERFTSCALTKTNFPIKEMIFIGHSKRAGKRKILKYNTLKKYFTNESLSIWIADDGSLSYNNNNKLTPVLYLHTQGFAEEQIDELIILFKRKYQCVPSKYVDKKVENGSGIFLRFSTKDTLYILNQLRSLHCKGVEYKYYFPTEGYIPKIKNEYTFNDFKIKNPSNSPDIIKYDLEIEDNHNYFANNILIHNCRTIYNNGKLFSRQNSEFKSLPHIIKSLSNCNMVLDGELYSDQLTFQEIISLVKRDEPHEDCEKIHYHVYDEISDHWFLDRIKRVQNLNYEYINPVKTYDCKNEEEMLEFYSEFMKQGYEGIMIRNKESSYKNNSRSKDLQKYKKFMDEEFKIVDVISGKGKFEDCGIYVCEHSGKTFNVTPKCSEDEKRQILTNKNEYLNKMLTVKFFEWTTSDVPLPRFPIGIAVRDYE